MSNKVHFDKIITGTVSFIEPPSEEGEGGKEKASLELLQQDYGDLNSRKIKDSLSSFLPDIPGKQPFCILDVYASRDLLIQKLCIRIIDRILPRIM